MPTDRLTIGAPSAPARGLRQVSQLGYVMQWFRIMRAPIGYAHRTFKEYGSTAAFRAPKRLLVVTFDPEHNRILHSDQERFIAKGFIMPGPAGWAQRQLPTSLFTMNGETHKPSRQLLLPLFQKSFLHTYHADLVDGIENLLSSWRHGQRLDLPTEMRRWSWSTAGRLLYGLDVSGCDDALRHEIDRWAALNFGWATRGMPVDLPFFPYRRLLNRARSVRSEERRVGKECRSRWSPYH